MPRPAHKFPESTFGRVIPGVGITITRANVRAEQERRAKEGQPLASVEEIYKTFVRTPKPGQRHVNRINHYLETVPMRRD